MGFLHGIKQIGEFYSLQEDSGNLEDIRSFLELPMKIPNVNTPPDKIPAVIRVGLDVDEIEAEQLNVKGIISISLAQYPGMDEDLAILKFLFKKTSANVRWYYGPVYELGKGGGENALATLVGSSTPDNPNAWQMEKKTSFFRLYNRVVKGFEESGCFSAGSAERIMQSLFINAETLAEKWQDKNRSFILVFGILTPQGDFLFPGDLPAFVKHFRTKISSGVRSKEMPKHGGSCALCGKPAEEIKTLNKIFKFSTFDKPNFLPGWDQNSFHKVFPVCKVCFEHLSRGTTEIRNRCAAKIGMVNHEVLIIPEVIGGQRFVRKTLSNASSYFQGSVDGEQNLFEGILERESSFVFHFLFTETNQAQVVLHRIIEDIPPSQFKKIKNLWGRTTQRFGWKQNSDSLDQLIQRIVAMILSLSGKSQGDQSVTKDKAIDVVAALFNNEWIDVEGLKKLAVARLPGLFADDEWLNGQKKDQKNLGGRKLENMLMLFEFLTTANRNLEKQEV